MFLPPSPADLKTAKEEISRFQANPWRLTFDVTGEDTFISVNSLFLELQEEQTGTVRATEEIINPSGSPITFEFSGSQMNWPPGKYRLVLSALQPDKDEVSAADLITLAQWDVRLLAHHASLTTAPAPTPITALTAAQASALYATITSVETLQAQVDSLGSVDLSAYSTTAQMNTAIGTASTDDRARANHTGTQATDTITGLDTTLTNLQNDINTRLSLTAYSAKGTIPVGVADGEYNAVPVGITNGMVLTVDAAEATGVKWATVTVAIGSITGLGTSVATALAVNVGTAGSIVVNGGALGTPSSGTLTNCTFPSSIVTLTGAQTLTNKTLDASQLTGNTVIARITANGNGAASTPPVALSGTWFTTGTATTTKPQFLVEPSGTTSTGWSTAGTGLGINAGAAFVGNLLDLQLAGTSKFKVDAFGNVTMPNVPITFGVGAQISGSSVLVHSGYITKYSSTSAYNGTADLGHARNAAGVLEINNGTAGTYRDLILRGILLDTIKSALYDSIAVSGSNGTQIIGFHKAPFVTLPLAGFIGWSANTAVTVTPTVGFTKTDANTVGVTTDVSSVYQDIKARCYKTDRTDTPAGTTGAQTQNKGAGTVNFAAAATSLVVTNSLVTATTKIIATLQTNDTTAKSVAVVAASGSFTIYLNAAATAETAVSWQISG